MGLIERIKSALGLGTPDRSAGETGRSGSRDVDVTVEHEPATASEDAVKGTDTASTTTPNASSDASESSDGETTPEPDVETAEPGDETEEEGVEKTTETDEPADAEGAETEPAPDVDLEDVKGIGPTYAERLRDAGVESVADLAVADPEALDEETGIGPTRLSKWVERARER